MPFLGVLAGCWVAQAIGVGIAFATFKFGAYNEKITVAAESFWTFAAFSVVAFTIRFVNFYPMVYKERVMKGALREEIGANMRSNPFIYKSVSASKDTVLFDNDGAIGMYNRANRSLTHMIENFGSMLAGLMLAGSVFPFPTFVCACAFGVGRVMHQVGYSGGYGKHGAGFMVATVGALTLEGLILLVVFAGLGLVAVPEAAPTVEARMAALEAALNKVSMAVKTDGAA